MAPSYSMGTFDGSPWQMSTPLPNIWVILLHLGRPRELLLREHFQMVDFIFEVRLGLLGICPSRIEPFLEPLVVIRQQVPSYM